MTVAAAVWSRGAYEGVQAGDLAARFALPAVVALTSTGSTLDVAHALAADGAPDGTLVLAETQTAGRGRSGKRWTSEPGAGIWMTLIERNLDPATLSLLALRLGIATAVALGPFADVAIGIKWPNDLYLGAAKLAGILAEARWRDGAPEWVAIGIGINARRPAELPYAAALRAGVRRLDVLDAVLPRVRAAAVRRGNLDDDERSSLAARDIARGRAAASPAAGLVTGISAAGELLIRAPDGAISSHRSGSLLFAEES